MPTGAELLIQALVAEGVDTIFGYPGGAVLHIYDELWRARERITHYLVRHEQGAVHMAEGYARATGRVGVVLVTSGPGATNAVTGIANAYMDSTPLVVITGQVPKHLIGTDAFQEVDTVGITRPCVKHNYLVRDARDLAAVVREAFHLARSGRPGPVVIDIPKDVSAQRANSLTFGPREFSLLHQTGTGGRGARAACASDDPERKAPGPIHRWRYYKFWRRRFPALVCRGIASPRFADADGARRISELQSSLSGHAGHARNIRREHGCRGKRSIGCSGSQI